MDLYRLRVEVPDEPGRIGRVLVALGRLAVNIVEIDCHNVDDDVRVDDLFVHATRPLDLPTIAHAVENTGCPLIEIRPLSVHDLEDPVTRSTRYVTHVATAQTVTDDLIAWCAGELVRADLACVIDSRIASAGSAAGRALAQSVPVHDREWANDCHRRVFNRGRSQCPSIMQDDAQQRSCSERHRASPEPRPPGCERCSTPRLAARPRPFRPRSSRVPSPPGIFTEQQRRPQPGLL
ncbi:MAG: ACT domain-containing protein [Ilumatobacter sp.]